MELTTPEPEKVQVFGYDFKLVHGQEASADVWPTLGDTLEQTSEEFVFRYPRLKVTQTIYRAHVVGVIETESLRVFLDQAEILKRVKERKEQKEAEDHGKTKDQG